ncbi:ribbon-helix-helix protein, CopG family [Micromonospora sp. STR1s_5]|nr:ribbon-helix-helix protein, CopG family [Micromonospora sp. STR1s_5]
MAKAVISVRLSEERLAQLDRACAKLQMNRSEVIDAALRLLPELISGKAETSYAPGKIRKDHPSRSDSSAARIQGAHPWQN